MGQPINCLEEGGSSILILGPKVFFFMLIYIYIYINICRGKGPKSYIGLWASLGTIDESEERQMVVKGTPS